MSLVDDELVGVHLRVVEDPPPKVVVAQLAWDAVAVEGGEDVVAGSGAEPGLEVGRVK